MAGIIKITPIKILGRNVPTVFLSANENHTAPNGEIFAVENKTNRNLLLLVRAGGSEGWVKVKKGNGALASQNDLIVKVDGGESATMLIESGGFMQMDGDQKGNILIEPKAEEGIAVIAFD